MVRHFGRHILRPGAGWLVLVPALLLAGCSVFHPADGAHWYWPFHHAKAQGPQAVAVLGVAGAADSGGAPPQYWDRNALRLDLTGVAAQGELHLAPLPGHHWPIRLELTVTPGRFTTLEVSAEERVVLAVPASGNALTFKLDPGIYTLKSAALNLRWGS